MKLTLDQAQDILTDKESLRNNYCVDLCPDLDNLSSAKKVK